MDMMDVLAITDQAKKTKEFRVFIIQNEPHFKFKCFEGASLLFLWYRTGSVNSLFQRSTWSKRKHNVLVLILIIPIWRFLFLGNSKAFYYPLFPLLKGFHRFWKINIILTTMFWSDSRCVSRVIVNPPHQCLGKKKRD